MIQKIKSTLQIFVGLTLAVLLTGCIFVDRGHRGHRGHGWGHHDNEANLDIRLST